MCLIIHSPAGSEVPTLDIIESAIDSNPDGVGIVTIDGKVERFLVIKAEKLHRKLIALKNTEYAIHFRMGTHGTKTFRNVHPFKLGINQGWLMHNGVLSTGNKEAPNLTDTECYIRKYLNPIFEGSKRPDWNKVGSHIGTSNKFVVFNEGIFTIVNKSQGIEHEGNWYSNTYAWNAHDHGHGYADKWWTGRGGFSIGKYGDYGRWTEYDELREEDQLPKTREAILRLLGTAIETIPGFKDALDKRQINYKYADWANDNDLAWMLNILRIYMDPEINLVTIDPGKAA